MRIIIIVFSLFLFSNSFAQSGWIIQKSGTTKDLRGISTYDGVNAVVVGVNGTVLTTNNIGVPWFAEINPTPQNLNGVTSINAKLLLAVGPKDSVYRSTNRGATWKGYRSRVRGECYTVASINELNAIDYDTITNVCVAVGDQDEIIFSEDSGLHWEERLPSGNEGTRLHCVSSSGSFIVASGDTVGDALGGPHISRIFLSENEGDSWTKSSTDFAGIDTKAVHSSFYGCNSLAHIIVGKNGHIYHTRNKGQIWDSIPSWTTANLNAVNFADELNGFIVGDSGVILVTDDGGYNWQRQVSPTKKNLRSVSMGNPFHGFICGDSGIILVTQDGGFSGVHDFNNRVFLDVQNYPNPFPSKTTIHIDLPQTGHINLTIFNMLGVEIAKIADGEFDAGSHAFRWNAADVPNGVYVCRLVADGKSVVSQMIVTK